MDLLPILAQLCANVKKACFEFFKNIACICVSRCDVCPTESAIDCTSPYFRISRIASGVVGGGGKIDDALLYFFFTIEI